MSQMPTDQRPPEYLRADAARNLHRIVEVAARLLGDDPHVGMAAVAGAADVSRATVYRHFPTREALLDGLSEWYDERVADFPGDVAADGIAPTIAQVFADFDTQESLARAVLASPGGRREDPNRIGSRGRGGTGRRAGFRCRCRKRLGGSSPSARIQGLELRRRCSS